MTVLKTRSLFQQRIPENAAHVHRNCQGIDAGGIVCLHLQVHFRAGLTFRAYLSNLDGGERHVLETIGCQRTPETLCLQGHPLCAPPIRVAGEANDVACQSTALDHAAQKPDCLSVVGPEVREIPANNLRRWIN
jgi:hypothetical protein